MHDWCWQAIDAMIAHAQAHGPGEYEFSLVAYDTERKDVIDGEWRVTVTVQPRRINVDMLRVD